MCLGLEILARVTLVILNIIIWLVGTGLIVILLLLYFLPDWNQYPIASDIALYVFIVFMIVGCFLFIFGFSGCCGACCGSFCCMTIYLVFVYIIFGCALALCIWFGTTFNAFSDDDRTVDNLMDTWIGYISEGNETSIDAFESMQDSFKCCGVSNGYNPPCEMWYNVTTDDYMEHLASCECSKEGRNDTSCSVMNTTAHCGTSSIYTQGCDEALAGSFGGVTIGITSVLIFFTIAALVLVVVSCYTVCRLKKSTTSTVPSYEMTDYEKAIQ